jgi:type III restriction enzyme
MLYTEFNSIRDALSREKDLFKKKALEQPEILKNLNPDLALRPYQQEALGRFYFYLEDYQQKKLPAHLMFNMATGSGKTLIMAASILYLYGKGYRNFIFFTRLDNIIQKTRANFLDPNSKKYLFAKKIVIDGKIVRIREVDNFEGASGGDINIMFTTIANLHARFNSAKEDAITFEDLADKEIVLLGDEAHNFSAETRTAGLTKEEEKERNSWERTIVGDKLDLFNKPGMLYANRDRKNILLEFTATAQLDNEAIQKKYEDKVIFRYDLKEYRLDGFSKEVMVKQIDAPLMERVLAVLVISQYRRKAAEKHKIALKPVVMFKANRVTMPKTRDGMDEDNPKIVVSSEFKEKFHRMVAGLKADDLEKIERMRETGGHQTLAKAFEFFRERGVTLANLAKEIQSDFAPEKCLSVDDADKKDEGKNQILLNSLEDYNNEIRAVFATEKLNEGWDVLNLFDIVRLYNSRDAKNGRPGKTTAQEAQLIGRGARYYPFITDESDDRFRRKFDNDIEDELRIIEQLFYHSMRNSDYISELTKALVETGIMPEKKTERKIEIKELFKKSDIWKKGLIFLNSRQTNGGERVTCLDDLKASFDSNNEGNIYNLSTREASESAIYAGSASAGSRVKTDTVRLSSLGGPAMRSAIEKAPSGKFIKLKKIFGNIKSVADFIFKEKYLGSIEVKVRGTGEQLSGLSAEEKLKIAFFAIDRVIAEASKNRKEYVGTREFEARLVKEVFGDKMLMLDGDSPRAQEMKDFDFASRKWFAQNEIWGTSEEEAFIKFMDLAIGKLEKKYRDIALLRNEQFFKIYNFEDGEAFSPDFVLFLVEKKTKQETVYQIFIEPKGDGLLDENHRFEKSKEGWKQKFLLEIEKSCKIKLKLENKDFKLIGLPFFNEGKANPELKAEFEDEFKGRLL